MGTVAPAPSLLYLSPRGIVGQHHSVYTRRPALGIPTVLMAAAGQVGQQLAVVVVGIAGIRYAVGRLVVSDDEIAHACIGGFLDVAKRIVAERLALPRAAVGCGNPSKIVVGVVAGLVVGCTGNLVVNRQAVQATVGIPGERAGIGLAVHTELIGMQPSAVRIIGK